MTSFLYNQNFSFNFKEPGPQAREGKLPKEEASKNASTGAHPRAPARAYTVSGKEAIGAEGLIQGKGDISGNFLTLVLYSAQSTRSFPNVCRTSEVVCDIFTL